MKAINKKYFRLRPILLLFAILTSLQVYGQFESMVKWTYYTRKTATNEYDLIFAAKINHPWHMYSQYSDQSNDAPESLSFTFTNGAYSAIGKVKEICNPVVQYDDQVKHDLKFFPGFALFSQHIKINGAASVIKGNIRWMVCGDNGCKPPEEIDFSFDLSKVETRAIPACDGKTPAATNIKTNPATKPVVATEDDKKIKEDHTIVTENKSDTTSKTAVTSAPTHVKKKHKKAGRDWAKESLWIIFLLGFGGGFLAILTPCVFPMIPLTVGFFNKKKKSRGEGIRKAVFFGLSIIFIYVGLGLAITAIFGHDILNSVSSNVYVNLAFFLIFLIFAISFLGAFEITLPASWTNSSDRMSEKSGLVGIFFMAFTLALVSFSCTGPVVGPLLVLTSSGNYITPIVGMTGFSLALALPFTLFAAFPSMMHNLPRSGGWLNSVKVTLGFVELALALKFFSAADYISDWGILKREYFLALWIIIFFLLGLYLIGKLKFSHDSDTSHVSVTRLMFAIMAFGFTAYMVPGLWGAPLNILSGIAPPEEYNEGTWLTHSQNSNSNSSGEDSKTTTVSHGKKKYEDIFASKTPLGLDAYYDYNEALSVAKKLKKPLLIDFTGIVCTNCRKMENTVWANPEVLKRLKNDIVLVSLYMDSKTKLDSNEVYISKKYGKKITTIGEKWNDLAASRFGTNTLPNYVLVDQNEEALVEPMGYDADIQKFIAFLEEAKTEYKDRQ